MRKVSIYLVLILVTVFSVVYQCVAQVGFDIEPADNYQPQVFLSKEEALMKVFPDCDEVVYDEIILTDEEKEQIQDRLKRKIFEDSFITYIGINSGKVVGYAIITEEIGKFHPYTFIVSVNPKGKIRDIAVLVYRESRGAEIAHKRFLYQFKGKSLKSPLRINKDIINITGATMSVVTMCTGVKKVLAVIDQFYLSGKRTDGIASMERVKFGDEGQERELTLFKKAALSMGTVFEISAYVTDKYKAEKAFNDVFKEINRLDYLMSNYKEESELSRVNKNAASEPTTCDNELAYVIEQSLQYSDITDGAFDITIGPLMKKWGFFKGQGKVPGKEDLESVLESVSYKNIIIEEEIKKSLFRGPSIVKTVSFKNPGTQIDLGGIGKGYAVDMATRILKGNGIRSALINFAGNIYAYGTPPGKESWVIGLQHPRKSEDILNSFEVKDKAVSTSGDYEKFFILDGKRYSHIIDPRTGNPVKEIVSVTIVADTATRADALSTGVFVLGLDKGMELIENLPDVEGIIVYERNNSELQIKTSSGLKGLLKDDIEESSEVPESDAIITGS
ncbi:MAG: FAD:protein FMN transferase [Candidatus Scalinduaceae bacterium]